MNTNSKATRILCYGDSNTWGWVPGAMGKKRLGVNERWTGMLQKMLGDAYEVVEEGLGGRTTAFDDLRPEFPERNGLKSLSGILESHLPLDLFIVMLGTTDTKEMLGKNSKDIADGMAKVVRLVKNFKVLVKTKTPRILIVVPPIVDEKVEFASKLFRGGGDRGERLVNLYKKMAEKEGCSYLNPNQFIKVSAVDGVHIDRESHNKLARMIAKEVISMIPG